MPNLLIMPYKFHREGKPTLILTCFVILAISGLILVYLPEVIWIVLVLNLILLLMVLQFFRNPIREIPEINDAFIYAPADGKIVTIEEVQEDEYFKQKKLQVSIFMSPLNVHVNRIPTGGKVRYVRHHHGNYLVAWHPKSSTENERCTTVIESASGTLLMRQIAGALARRIVNYSMPEQTVNQGEEFGFIKFGSRVDVFLPLDAQVLVKIGQHVKGNLDKLAAW